MKHHRILPVLPACPSILAFPENAGGGYETGSLGEEGEGEKKRREDTQEGTEKRKNECVLKQASSRFLGLPVVAIPMENKE